jgi:glycosyltransferase involved in cell wall biosynthesis
LWFSPVQIKEDLTSGSWVTSLAANILRTESVELYIAFKAKCNELEEHKIGRLSTWHVPSNEFSKYKVIISNLFNKEIDENIGDRFSEVVRIVNPDIIQIFGTESDLGMVIFNTEIPFVFHIQSVFHVYYHKYFSGLTAKDIKKYSLLKLLIFRMSELNNYKRRIKAVVREEQYYKKGRYFLGRTDWDRRCASILGPDARYFHCDETIREEFFMQKWSKEFNGQEIRLLSIISGSIYKGLETIIEATELLEKVSKYKILWDIIGINKDSESVVICKKKYGKRLSNSINFIGRINSSSEMIKLMQNSDFFVHPSHIENSPNSICEAMVLGMPIIATNTGGTSSLLKDNESGILIQDGDPWSMAGAILELYKDHEKAIRFSEKARETAIERHDPNKIVDNLMQIYKQIISENKKVAF